jgi:hypothetical protein
MKRFTQNGFTLPVIGACAVLLIGGIAKCATTNTPANPVVNLTCLDAQDVAILVQAIDAGTVSGRNVEIVAAVKAKLTANAKGFCAKGKVDGR